MNRESWTVDKNKSSFVKLTPNISCVLMRNRTLLFTCLKIWHESFYNVILIYYTPSLTSKKKRRGGGGGGKKGVSCAYESKTLKYTRIDSKCQSSRTVLQFTFANTRHLGYLANQAKAETDNIWHMLRAPLPSVIRNFTCKHPTEYVGSRLEIIQATT